MRLVLTAAVVLGLAAASAAIGGQASAANQSEVVRQASSATVQPLATPAIPEGNTGIAAKYPGDVGIEKDPDVVFVESFEGSVDEICSHWEAAAGKPIMSKSDEVPPGSGGKQSLLLTRVAGGTDGYLDGGNLYRRLKNENGRLRLRPALLPLLHEVQPGARPDSPLRERAGRLPPAHALAPGRGRRAAEGRCTMDHAGRAGRLHHLELLQLLARDGRKPASGSDLGEHLRDRRAAPHRRQGEVDLPRSHGQDERHRRQQRRAGLLARREAQPEPGRQDHQLPGQRLSLGRHLDLRQVQTLRDRARASPGTTSRARAFPSRAASPSPASPGEVRRNSTSTPSGSTATCPNPRRARARSGGTTWWSPRSTSALITPSAAAAARPHPAARAG